MDFLEDDDCYTLDEIRARFIQSPNMSIYAFTDEAISTELQINHAVSTETRERIPGESCYPTLFFNYDPEREGDDIENGVIFEGHITSLKNIIESMDIPSDIRIWHIEEGTPGEKHEPMYK